MVTEVHNWYLVGPVKQKPGTHDMYRVIHCSYEVSAWIMEQDPVEWIYIPMRQTDTEPAYWVSDRLILLLTIRWPVTYLPEF